MSKIRTCENTTDCSIENTAYHSLSWGQQGSEINEELRVVELGNTDTSHSTALYVASIGLVISGDCVYNNTHLYLAECDEEARSEWLRALDKIESLHPKAVVATSY